MTAYRKAVILPCAVLMWCAGARAASASAAIGFDAVDGPVVADARAALAAGTLDPAVKWVQKEDVNELRAVFNQVLAVRAMGPEAQALADRYFSETLVRLYCRGQGEPYAGLKPAGAGRSPAVAEAEKALNQGSDDTLIKLVTDRAAVGVRKRFKTALDKKRRAEQSPEAGREYVGAAVDFFEYVDRLQSAIAGEPLRPGGRE